MEGQMVVFKNGVKNSRVLSTTKVYHTLTLYYGNSPLKIPSSLVAVNYCAPAMDAYHFSVQNILIVLSL